MQKLSLCAGAFSALCVALLAEPAAGQDASSILRDVERGVESKPSEVSSTPIFGAGELSEPDEPSPRDSSGESFRVNGFRIEAASVPVEELLAEVQAYIGRDCTMGDLREAAARIASAYRKRNLLAYVSIPRQTLRDGVVVFKVVEARLGEVQIEAPRGVRLKPGVAQSFITSRVDDAGPVKLDKVVEGIAALRSIPGVDAHGTLRAGKVHGTTDLRLLLSEKQLVSSTFVIDNYTTEQLGGVRGLAVVSFNDFDRGGSQLTLTGQLTKRSQYAEVSITRPLLNGRIWLDGSLFFVGYKIPASAGSPNVSGGGGAANLGLRWNALARTKSPLKIASSIEYRWFDNDLANVRTSSNKLYVFSLSAQRVMRAQRGRSTVLDLSLRLGNLDLGANPGNLAFDRVTAKTQGTFARLTGSIAQGFKVSEDLALELTLKGQAASKNLNGIERLAFGGPGSIAGYSISAIDGDEGVLTSLAVSKQLSSRARISASWAGGFVVQHKQPWQGWASSPGDRNSYGFHGIGLSAKVRLPGNFHLSAEAGLPLTRQPSAPGNAKRPIRGWLQLVHFFD